MIRTKCQQGLWKFWELSHVHHESCSGIILNVLLVTAILCVCWNKYLVRVSVEVKILQEARSKFTEQEIVCVIDGPEAPVCVVVGTGACTEWTHWGSEEGGVYKEGRGESGKQEFEKRDSKYCCHHFCSENSARNKEVCSTMILFEQLAKSIDYPSLVQKGAVCQWWLSCVKQVRPGMLHVSLFWSLLRNFRSFFLRFCSFCNHWVFCFDGILINTKHTSQLAWVRNSKLLHSKRVLYILPEWEHSSCIKLESLLIRSEITEKTKSAVRCAESLCWCLSVTLKFSHLGLSHWHSSGRTFFKWPLTSRKFLIFVCKVSI